MNSLSGPFPGELNEAATAVRRALLLTVRQDDFVAIDSALAALDRPPAERVDSGDKAIAVLRSGGFDLMIVDLVRDGMAHLAVIERLRSDPLLSGIVCVAISANVESTPTQKAIEIGIDDLLKKMPLEERLYRHRCVEAWSMAVPWSGFAMSALVALAKPLSAAKYLRMETFLDAAEAPGQKQFWYPWPYIEGVTLAEANNELAFMVTGMYGKPVPKQDGAPLRLVLPWKYGFKSVKSIVRISFTDKQPTTFWQTVQGDEYGFWANVNPEVPHPRWSQETERVLGTDQRVPTQKWNGYGEFVAHLYDGLQNEKLFM